jgi:serine/threonine protein kinase
MVQGDIPFEKDDQICSARVEFRRSVSESCQDLVRQCLRIRPQDRISLEAVLVHPWLSGVTSPAADNLSAVGVCAGSSTSGVNNNPAGGGKSCSLMRAAAVATATTSSSLGSRSSNSFAEEEGVEVDEEGVEVELLTRGEDSRMDVTVSEAGLS